MNYRCDTCDVELEPGYVPEVDGRGRPCLAICADCKAEDLAERFERVLRREIRS